MAVVRDGSRSRRADRRGREGVRPLLVVDAGCDQPDRGRRRRGALLLGLRRQALPRLRLTARQRQHRPPAPEDHRRDQGAGGQASARSGRRWPRSRARASVACSRRSRRATSACRSSRTRARRRTRTRSELARLATGRHKIVARYRSYHGATHGSILLTGDPRRWPNEPGMGGVVRMLDPYTYRCPAGHPDPCPVCTGAPHLEEILEYEGRAHRRRGDPGDGDGDERCHPAAAGLSAGDPRGLRPARDPADPRRGHGRVRTHGPLVRMRELGRRSGHHHRGEGDQLGLRPARRDDHPRAPEGMGAEPVLPRRAHVRGSSARVRVRGRLDRGLPGGGCGRERGRGRRVPRRRSAIPRRAPSVHRRRARPRVLLGRRAREEP